MAQTRKARHCTCCNQRPPRPDLGGGRVALSTHFPILHQPCPTHTPEHPDKTARSLQPKPSTTHRLLPVQAPMWIFQLPCLPTKGAPQNQHQFLDEHSYLLRLGTPTQPLRPPRPPSAPVTRSSQLTAPNNGSRSVTRTTAHGLLTSSTYLTAVGAAHPPEFPIDRQRLAGDRQRAIPENLAIEPGEQRSASPSTAVDVARGA